MSVFQGLNVFSQWLEARREAKRQARFERGFAYVMVAYHWHGHPKAYIEDVSYRGSWDMTQDPYDDGVREALRMIPEDKE